MICYWKYFFIIVLNIFMVTTDQSFEVSPQQLISKELKEETNVELSMTNDQDDYYIEYFKPGREVETELEPGLNPEDSDICNQPLEEGSCFFSFLFIRWYYDSSNDECNTFQYSGCGGNDNNFYGLHECVKRCVKKVTKDETTVVDLLPTSTQVDNTYTELSTAEIEIWKEDRASVCSQPKDPGYCGWRRINVYYSRLQWYYENTTNDCRIFWYVGCRGNGNRFHDSKTCKSLCIRSTSKDITTVHDWQPTSHQIYTFGYEDPKTKTERDINDLEGDEFEIIVENGSEKSYRSTNRITYIILTIAFFAAVTGLRWLIVKCRHAEREMQVLRDTSEAERTQQQTLSSDEDSAVRISMCLISLNNSENQSRNEPTQSCSTMRSDKKSSQSQPFLPSYQQSHFPPAPPPYEP